ncbi:peroxiredoxin [Sandaracinobacteroides saxicola]|uniref:Glutathione-dependent peroxiredoxin n=1 Tax=Sandaracinobacteroides saxicola TaxID=2759707 RepID=A0A7G5IN00_9SPHN|nr:peroxiredoxin [Sandaracinobacteroides saxicola]QMW24742.1 peroxiredoxin [Sandaracinobacteroides saxicola]
MIGRRVPDVTFRTRVRDASIGGDNPFRWQDMTSADYFAGKRVVLFGLPGAFTPTCSNEQCPAYERSMDAFARHGVSEVYCLSVNDAFVMYQWGLKLGLKRVALIPDGSGHFTRGLGMLVNKDHLGFGWRSWRYSMVVNDGIIEAFFEEPGRNDEGEGGDPYEVSDPETILRWLEADAKQPA